MVTTVLQLGQRVCRPEVPSGVRIEVWQLGQRNWIGMSVKLVGKDAGRYQFASSISSVRSVRSTARGFKLSGGTGRRRAAQPKEACSTVALASRSGTGSGKLGNARTLGTPAADFTNSSGGSARSWR